MIVDCNKIGSKILFMKDGEWTEKVTSEEIKNYLELIKESVRLKTRSGTYSKPEIEMLKIKQNITRRFLNKLQIL